MLIFGLYITTAKKHKLKADAEREEKKRQDEFIAKLMAEKTQLIKNCEALLTMNKSRQLQRQLARRQNKQEAKLGLPLRCYD